MPELTITETADLRSLEATIDRGQTTFIEVGQALLEIQQRKLYRATHGTWDAYCRARWGWGASRGRQLIGASRFAMQSDTEGNGAVPANERQTRALRAAELAARALASMTPAQQVEAIQAAEEEADAEEESPSAPPRSRGPRTVGGDQRAVRLAQIDRTGRQLHQMIAGLGDEAEAALGHLVACLAAVRGLPE